MPIADQDLQLALSAKPSSEDLCREGAECSKDETKNDSPNIDAGHWGICAERTEQVKFLDCL